MRKRLTLALAFVLLAVTGAAHFGAPAPAAAHSASTYYNTVKWPSGTDVDYALNAGTPATNAFRDAIFDGKQQWNLAVNSNSEPEYFWSLPDGVNYGSFQSPCGMTSGVGTLVVFYADLDVYSTTYLGGTLRCSSGGTSIVRVSVTIDNDRSWYMGTGDAPSTQYDLWSVASHEFGHGTGWNDHLPSGETGVCPNPVETVLRATMCPTIAIGTEVQRDLVEHDKHTFLAAY